MVINVEDPAPVSGLPGLGLIDCDVHPTFPGEWTSVLAPYLPDGWRQSLVAGQERGSTVSSDWPGVRFTLPHNGFYPRSASPVRIGLIDEHGTMPSSDPIKSAEDLLDRYAIQRAILIPQGVFGIGALPNDDVAPVIASAANEWLIDKWLPADSRWRASLAIAPQDPGAALKEIERWGGRSDVVGLFISLNNILLGQRHFWPLYEAAEHYNLPIILHVTGTEGIHVTSPQLAGGVPKYHMEYRIGFTHPYQANLVSLVAHGVFERFHKLKVVFAEVGFAWLPEILWRLDAFWKAARQDTPWVKRLPSEYVIDHCRFTTQPFIEPPRRRHVAAMLEMISADKTLMFASDYPHWDFDDPLRIVKDLPSDYLAGIMGNTARATFGDRMD